MMERIERRAAGFSLVELLIVMAIFMVVTGAVFGLLGAAQIRHRSEQELVDAMQAARVAVERLTRDIHNAGYPTVSTYDILVPGNIPTTTGTGYITDLRVPDRFPGIKNNLLTRDCTVDTVNPTAGTCDVPGPYQLLIEADLDPDNPILLQRQKIEWVYYRLETPPASNAAANPIGGGERRTLYRLVSEKKGGVDPRDPAAVRYKGNAVQMIPFVENVMNDPNNGDVDAVFRYVCLNAALTCTPNNIQEVRVELRVQTRTPDPFNPVTPGGELNYRTVVLRTTARPLNR